MYTSNDTLNPDTMGRLREGLRQKSSLPLEVIGMDGAPMPFAVPEERQPLCALLCGHAAARSCCQADHRRAIQSAFDYGESYSFVCHAGLLVNCTPLADRDRQLGALLSGMTLPEKPGEVMVEEVRQRLSIFGLHANDIQKAINGHVYVDGNNLQETAVAVEGLARSCLRLDDRVLKSRREHTKQLARIAERIHAVKLNPDAEVSYPYEREKKLIEKVKFGDRQGAKGVLNEILGTILFRDPMGSAVLKTRLVELLAVLSRAAAESGVDSGQILKQNLTYFEELLGSNNDNDLCAIISRALNNFLDTVCSNSAEQVRSPVGDVVHYIESNYMNELTVEELARQAHLSTSRLAHLFQEQMGTTMISVLTRVRIDQAKKLLLRTNLSCTEIAFQVGYKDQSYFTRIFRQQEATTPRQFRTANRTRPTAATLE